MSNYIEIEALVKIAMKLDDLGLHHSADKIDEVCHKADEKSYMFEPQLKESIKRMQRILSEMNNREEGEPIPDWMESYMSTISDRVTSVHDAFLHRI